MKEQETEQEKRRLEEEAKERTRLERRNEQLNAEKERLSYEMRAAIVRFERSRR
eukprot:CAMPEP_0119085548 /NCGR_PEP_ID=MMETSP1178-20130426/134325_1 /TAXON_ID=33656 /ORGANISM="unid sp, Strain CCMP2000" /LENGTH=53 /DNA_ID=CAMNT_0007068613 /DNA_START=24 /DNA_END=181 /DNA_ORIENTATION=+